MVYWCKITIELQTLAFEKCTKYLTSLLKYSNLKSVALEILSGVFDFLVETHIIGNLFFRNNSMDRVKRIWYLSPMRAAKVQASLRIRAVSPEPPLLAHTSCKSRGTFRQKARSLAPPNGWACAVKICHDGMLEDTNSLDGAQIIKGLITDS